MNQNSQNCSRQQLWLQMRLQYTEFDRSIEDFTREIGVRCPEGCGVCCTGTYEPEVTSVEAEYAARYILDVRKDLEQRFTLLEDRSYCIFYDESTPLHCMIYEARPIICRGFGFSGYTDKNGKFIYRPCRHMVFTPLEKTETGPLLSAYQSQYLLEYRHKQPISEAIAAAWQKLLYYRSMEEGR